MTFSALILIMVVALLLSIACGQGAQPDSPIIIVVTPSPSDPDSPTQSNGGTTGQDPIIVVATSTPGEIQTAVGQPDVQSPDQGLKDWTPQQHAAVDKAIEEAYGVFAKDLDECIDEIGEPEGGPFADDLARYEAAVTQSRYLECIQRKLSQN